MKMISRESVSCWYELGWDEDDKAIILRIHKDFIKEYPEVPVDSRIVGSLLREFKLEAFLGDFNSDIGFGGILKRKCDKGEFIEFSIQLPTLKNETGDCGFCSGSCKDSLFSNGKCIHCGGSGKEYVIDWKGAFAVSATFNVVFSYLSLFGYEDEETKCLLSQLMTINVTTRTGIYGGAISGTFSIDLVNWMSLFSPRYTIEEMVSAMRVAYGRIFAEKPDEFQRFRASVDNENGWLNVDCPGNACGLNPSSGRMGKGYGYNFSPHNTDSPLQQLTLLAGLAALHDKARREM